VKLDGNVLRFESIIVLIVVSAVRCVRLHFMSLGSTSKGYEFPRDASIESIERNITLSGTPKSKTIRGPRVALLRFEATKEIHSTKCITISLSPALLNKNHS
jgi:hypothetical protein